MKNRALMLAAFVLSVGCAVAADRDMANALAAAGRTHAEKGNYEMAKDQLFKALANDETCPEAVFELAKIFDKEGNAAAAVDFYQRATVLLAQDIKVGNAAKRAEALARLKTLNPFAPRITSVFEDYAAELDKLAKRNADALTQESALGRVQDLKLASVLTPDKMPKFYATAVANIEKEKADKEKADKEKTTSRPPSRSTTSSSMMHEKSGTTLPDVEKELKALGWTKITGSFVKKGPGLYEATDAKLEAPLVNGALSVTMIKEGSKGSMKVTARSDFNSDSSSSGTSSSVYSSYFMPGFGYYVAAKEYREYGPYVYSGFISSKDATVSPTSLGVFAMPTDAKVNFLLEVAAGEFVFTVNGRRNNKVNHNKTPQTGPFQIDINGTMLLETPRCAGQ